MAWFGGGKCGAEQREEECKWCDGEMRICNEINKETSEKYEY